MSKPKSPPPAPPPAPLVTPEEPDLIQWIAFRKVNGGYAVLTCESQGNRIVSKQIHTSRAESRDYAIGIFKAVTLRKLFYPERGPIVNMEE